MSKRLVAGAVVIASFSAAVFLMNGSRWSEAFIHVCWLVSDRYFEQSPELKDWSRRCVTSAQSLPIWADREAVLDEVRDLLGQLKGSHLNIFTPDEDRALWQGISSESGILSRWVEGEIIVFDVLTNSAADEAGVRKGDHVLRVDGKKAYTTWQVQYVHKSITIERDQAVLQLQIEAFPVKWNQQVRFARIGANGIITIPSFRSEFFEDGWQSLLADLNRLDQIIIDIRGNKGGNFVAMLRAASQFLCRQSHVGTLVQPSRPPTPETILPNELNDQILMKLLDENSHIRLETFKTEECYRGKLRVLMDHETSSVAEIFALAMKQRGNSELLGSRTAGDVLLATWYELPQFGSGYSISIPEALFMGQNQEIIEGEGVSPSQRLYYDLSEAKMGVDSWLARTVQ